MSLFKGLLAYLVYLYLEFLGVVRGDHCEIREGVNYCDKRAKSLCRQTSQHQIDAAWHEPEKNGQIPFLDTLITRREDGSIKLLIYGKATHKDQYLLFQSSASAKNCCHTDVIGKE